MTTETDTPIDLPVTPLGSVAALLLSAQIDNMADPSTERRSKINDKLAQARILVDVLRGDGE